MAIQRYGLNFSKGTTDFDIEKYMIRQGGQWTGKQGQTIGNGLFWHFRHLEEILWPGEKMFHRWNELQLREYLQNRSVGVMGPASSGKTNGAATDMLADYYVWPECTTILICSTTRERLEDRIWGEIKKYHKLAKRRWPNLPGNLIEGKQRIVTESREEGVDGRDFRNGIIGVACFCSGTQVDTPNGSANIEDLKVGDSVLNAFGVGKVIELHRRIAGRLIRVKLSDERVIDCTEEHPFLTNRGWIKSIDLQTLDRVYSVYETLQILQQPTTSGIPKPEVLQFGLPELSAPNPLPPVPAFIPPMESASALEEQQVHGQVLQHHLCGALGSFTPRMQIEADKTLQALWALNAGRTPQSGLLLGVLPGASDYYSLPSVRSRLHVNQGVSIEAENHFLQQVLQAEFDREKQLSQEDKTNSRGAGCVEAISAVSSPFYSEDWQKNLPRQSSLVSTGYSVSRHHVGCGDRWGNTQDASQDGVGRQKNGGAGITWVESVEILERDGDDRFDQNKGGYPVFNIGVSGHPSYSVNGVVVHNCVSGGNYRGLGDFIGIKNKRVRMAADELQLLPQIFVFSVSNLDKNEDFKVLGLGNPKETTDALGTLCEPATELGGWEGGIDQTPETKVWKTRFGGVCIQLVGTDSPNLDGKLGIPLITQEAIDRDVDRYGKDSLQFTMMNQGMMPKGQGSRRVITRQLCLKNRAMEQPEWLNSDRVKIAFLDAAYRGVGGDRCMYGELEFGQEAATLDEFVPEWNVASKEVPKSKHRQILALTQMKLVPVSVKLDIEPEEQIVSFVKTACGTSGIPPERFYFDAGMRTSLVTAFGRSWSPSVNSIDFGGMPSDRMVSADIQIPCNKYYSKFVTELWFNVRLVIENQQFRGMTEGVMQEGCAREWTMVGANKIEVEPKIKMKEKTGKSPDLFDALACGVFGATRHGFVIANLRNPEEKKRVSDKWKLDLMKKASASWHEGALAYDA